MSTLCKPAIMATAKIVLYTHKKLKEDKHPVMLRITSQGARKYVSLGYSVKATDWDFEENLPTQDSKLKRLVKKRQADADSIIEKYKWDGVDITIDEFMLEWARRLSGVQTVFAFFDDRINQIKKKSPGNADIYITTRNRLKTHRDGKDLRFSDITPQFLEGFRDFLEGEGVSGNSISVYMRTLRAVYNKAIAFQHARRELFPFGKTDENKFSISSLEEVTDSRALSKDQIRQIYYLDLTEYPKLIDARNVFIFSYLVRGIQFYDIAHLTWENLQDNRLKYRREKTKVVFNVKIQPETAKIIDFYKSQKTGNKYIFPVLDHRVHKTPQSRRDRIVKKRKQVNKKLEGIAFLAEIPKFTTYWARHSYANIQKDNGVPASMIKDLLGHTTEETTQIYLDKFGNETLDNLDTKLL